jgi:hypothetical protein
MKVTWRFLWTGSMAILLAACGGSGSSSNPSPSPAPSPGGGTITISNNAVSPRNITIARGSQVTFINNDSRAHEMFSDPHPEHTDCPEINDVGFLNPGESRQTGNMNTVRTCGFHDHNQSTVLSLQGTITIQ